MKKIMFNDNFGLEKSVLNKYKTLTRRIALSEPVENMSVGFDLDTNQCCICCGEIVIKRSQYAVGEVVAVAQRYKDVFSDAYHTELYGKTPGWTNKMFVSGELMPHHIKITNIKVEYLQDISPNDAIKEGIMKAYAGYYVVGIKSMNSEKKSNVDDENGLTWKLFQSPKEAFIALINKVSGKGTWNKNPLVFVYEFELVD